MSQCSTCFFFKKGLNMISISWHLLTRFLDNRVPKGHCPLQSIFQFQLRCTSISTCLPGWLCRSLRSLRSRRKSWQKPQARYHSSENSTAEIFCKNHRKITADGSKVTNHFWTNNFIEANLDIVDIKDLQIILQLYLNNIFPFKAFKGKYGQRFILPVQKVRKLSFWNHIFQSRWKSSPFHWNCDRPCEKPFEVKV